MIYDFQVFNAKTIPWTAVWCGRRWMAK